MIEVLGRANSVNVQKVMWCAAELRLEVTRRDVGGVFGGTDTATYLNGNPNGKIPTLVDDGFVLWESNAIVRYLCEQYGTKESDTALWFPTTVQQRAQANQWMDWNQTALHAPMTILFWQLIRTAEAARDQEAIAKAIQDSARFWEMLDRHLADSAFVVGERPSMADIPLGCSAYRWHSMSFDRPELVNLKRWWDQLAARRAYQEQVMLPIT